MTAAVVQKLDPSIEVALFRRKLRLLDACDTALDTLKQYSSLEAIWDGWDEAGQAIWLVTKVVGKTKAVELVRFAIIKYLREAHPSLARKCKDLPLKSILGELARASRRTLWDAYIMDETTRFVNHPARGYWVACHANIAIDRMENGVNYARAAFNKKIMRAIRATITKQSFLLLSRRMIKGMNLADLTSDDY